MGKGKGAGADCGIPNRCDRVVPGGAILLQNVPNVTMYILGGAILWMTWWLLAVTYIVYCLLSIVLFWRLICPYCHHFGTRACPSGYGSAAAAIFGRREMGRFKDIFRQRMIVVVPCWVVPLVGGAYLLHPDYSIVPLGLLVAFCVVAFAVVPSLPRFVGCSGCGRRKRCRWVPQQGEHNDNQ